MAHAIASAERERQSQRDADQEAQRLDGLHRRQAGLQRALAEASPEVRRAYEGCLWRMLDCRARGASRFVFFDKTHVQWARALGERLGVARMRTVAGLLRDFAKSTLHPLHEEFAADACELDCVWDCVPGYADRPQ